jgi:hypothetical protein
MKMKLVVLLAILFPPLLDKIILKIFMNIIVLNGMIRVNKSCHPFFSPLHTHEVSHEVIEGVVKIFATLVLIDHVMHDHTSVHDISKNFLISKSSRSSHNSK